MWRNFLDMKSDNSDKIKRYRGDRKRPVLKKRFLELLIDDKVLGKVSTAVKLLGINRDTVYDWRTKDATFAKEWDEHTSYANDFLADEAEHKLLEAIRAGNVSAIIFTLKALRTDRWNNQNKPVDKNNETMWHTVSPEFAKAFNLYK